MGPGGRGGELPFLSAEDTEGHGELQKPFCRRWTGILGFLGGDDLRELLIVGGGHGGARRTAKTFLSAGVRGFLDYWMGKILENGPCGGEGVVVVWGMGIS